MSRGGALAASDPNAASMCQRSAVLLHHDAVEISHLRSRRARGPSLLEEGIKRAYGIKPKHRPHVLILWRRPREQPTNWQSKPRKKNTFRGQVTPYFARFCSYLPILHPIRFSSTAPSDLTVLKRELYSNAWLFAVDL
jgi:hypothetical protein